MEAWIVAAICGVLFLVVCGGIIIWAGCRPLAKHYTTTIQTNGSSPGLAVGDSLLLHGYRYRVLATTGTTLTLRRCG